MFSNDTLKGKNILVTGGGSGLGLSMSKAFAKNGANVAICGRSEDKLVAAAEEISKQGAPGTQVLTYTVDVRDYEGVGRMIQTLATEFGELNGLVNNAAGNFLCPSEDLSPNGFKSVVDIVLFGTFNCTQQFGKYLLDNKKPGSILAITTTYTTTGSAYILPSAAGKAAVRAMMNSLAYEWGYAGIRCNCISPGPFPTEGAWARLMPPGMDKIVEDNHPMKRVGEHWELANLATFLMSDMAPYINGGDYVIDGGESLQGSEFNALLSAFSKNMPREQIKAILSAMRKK